MSFYPQSTPQHPPRGQCHVWVFFPKSDTASEAPQVGPTVSPFGKNAHHRSMSTQVSTHPPPPLHRVPPTFFCFGVAQFFFQGRKPGRVPDGVEWVIVWTLGGARVIFGRFSRKVTPNGSVGTLASRARFRRNRPVSLFGKNAQK